MRDVFLEVEPAVARWPDVAHARFFHLSARSDMLREADRDDLAQAELAEAVVEAGARRLGREAQAPPVVGEVVRDLDLGTVALDVDEPAVPDELTGRPQLHRPQAEAVLALVSDEPLDGATRALDRRRGAARDELHRLLVAENALVQHLGVADLERADDQARRLDREPHRVRNAIGCRLGRHRALSLGSSGRSARSASGHANQWRDATAPVVSSYASGSRPSQVSTRSRRSQPRRSRAASPRTRATTISCRSPSGQGWRVWSEPSPPSAPAK